MAWLQRTRSGWQRAKTAAHDARVLQPGMPLAGWANGDQLVYEVNPAYLEIGQGGNSPMRGYGAIVIVVMICLLVFFLVFAPKTAVQGWLVDQISIGMVLLGFLLALLAIPLLGFLFGVLASAFFTVTDPVVRLDAKRQMVWLWTGKGPIEIPWSRLVPRVESSVATAYATVKTYRGQFAELGPDGELVKTHGIPHVFQCGQISAAEEGVRPSMEYVRLYMEAGPLAVQPPETLLTHRTPWYAAFNFMGMGDEWVRWKANRDRPGTAPAPWIRTIAFLLFFPIFFPLQVTNWLALALAPRPKWPQKIQAMHAADLAQAQAEEARCRQANLTLDRAQEASRPPRKPVVRVNGEIINPNE